ncbi:MAG TPA: hypothetical protein VFF00_01920, partial [Candidatus Elarobacter sp.]|nr:hypothetical protein [Candidatus Elarobacter sp.]
MLARRIAAPPPYALASAALVALALATLPVAHAAVPALGIFIPASLVVAAAAEVATFGILISLYARAPRRSTGLLALAYLATAALSLVQAGSVPLGPSEGPVFGGAPHLPAWMYIARCIGCAMYAIAYAALRGPLEPELTPAQARRYLCRSALSIAAVTAAVIAGALALGGRFVPPHFPGNAEPHVSLLAVALFGACCA